MLSALLCIVWKLVMFLFCLLKFGLHGISVVDVFETAGAEFSCGGVFESQLTRSLFWLCAQCASYMYTTHER